MRKRAASPSTTRRRIRHTLTGAFAARVTSSPRLVVVLSVVFAMVATVGGILLALGGSIPISPYVTTLSFLIYVVCRVIGSVRAKRGLNGRVLRTA